MKIPCHHALNAVNNPFERCSLPRPVAPRSGPCRDDAKTHATDGMTKPDMFPLMTSRRFAPVFWCQFLSAFNDNFIKNALVILVLYKVAITNGPALVSLAGATLVIPFFFLSALGGELADKYDMARVAERLKRAEFPVAALAAIGFMMTASTNPTIVWWSVPVLFISLFLFGSLAALFGPIKYGILPDHLDVSQLPTANALMEGATFLAILGGTLFGGLAFALNGPFEAPPTWTVALTMIVLAGLGWWSATLIKPTGAGQPDLQITRNLMSSTMRLVRELRATRRLWIGGLVTSWFWLAGIVSLSLFPPLVKSHIGGDESVVTLGLVVFTIGIAIGSALAAALSKDRPNLALVPVGAALMGIFALDIGWAVGSLPDPVNTQALVDVSTMLSSPTGVRLAFDLGALAASGGLFIVPAFASVQSWAPPDHRARVIAAVNILNAAFMTTGTLSVTALQLFGITVPILFAGLGIANLIVAGLIMRTWGTRGERAADLP